MAFVTSLWPVADAALIEKFVKAFESVPLTYVADGHHRAKSGSRARTTMKSQNPNHSGNEEYNFFLSVLFPHDQLKILGYHRVVKDLNGYTPEEFLQKIKTLFDVTPGNGHGTGGYAPVSHVFWAGLGTPWKPSRAATTRTALSKAWDVSILQSLVLSPLLGIEDPRTDKRIDFVGGIRGMKELEKRCKEGYALAFALHPTTVETTDERGRCRAHHAAEVHVV